METKDITVHTPSSDVLYHYERGDDGVWHMTQRVLATTPVAVDQNLWPDGRPKHPQINEPGAPAIVSPKTLLQETGWGLDRPPEAVGR